jgi:hypothetical protein
MWVKYVCVLISFLVLLAPPRVCLAQSESEQVASSITRLEKSLASLKLPESDAKRLGAEFEESKRALGVGHLFYGLYKLQAAWAEVQTREYLNAKSAIGKEGAEAFESEWKRLGPVLDEKEKQLAGNNWRSSPAAVRALAESAQTQVRPYYQSGRLYGLNTTIDDGLYYLGLSPALLDYALFCQSLKFGQAPQAAFKLAPLSDALAGLESETLRSFRRAEADGQYQQNDTQRLRYIRANVTLKMASELNREKRTAGAFHKYLEATLYLGLADNPTPGDITRLKSQSEAFATRLKDSKVDHSIGRLYWEMAQAALRRAEEAPPGGEELKRATVILEKVLPAYFKLCGDKS